MAAKTVINLLPKDKFEFSTTGKFIKWALSTGRYVVILTEFIVILAFLSRFYFDTELANLFDELRQKQAIVESALPFEENFRSLQNKIKIVKTLLGQEQKPSNLITEISQSMPLNTTLTELIITENSLRLEGEAFSEKDLQIFLSGLINHPKLEEVALVNVSSKKESALGVSFNITATIKK